MEKAQEGVVFELATTSDKYPKTLRPMEALTRDMKAQVGISLFFLGILGFQFQGCITL